MSTNLPSINVPFTDAQGRITPIWHEFLRSFVTGVVEGTVVPPENAHIINAGNGLTGGGPMSSDVLLTVGQGQGLAVNANDVSVDIANQEGAIGTLDDEILISTPSENNIIRKTRLRDVAGLSSPGGSQNQVQFNGGGLFSGDSGFTYDVATGIVAVNALSINGTTISSANNAATSPFLFTVPGGSASAHYTFTQSSGGSDMPFEISSYNSTVELRLNSNSQGGGSTIAQSIISFKNIGSTKWTMGLIGSSGGSAFTLATTGTNVGNVFTVDATNLFLSMNTALLRNTIPNITASTTQTQGHGALIGEINEVATCANANDTVTLPGANFGRHCLVINHGAQTLQVFPESGDNLGAGLNTSTTIAAGSRKLFVSYNTVNWEPVI